MADHKIQWNGVVDDSELDSLASADNNEVPTSVDIVWGGYVPGWYPDKHATFTPVYFEDYDIDEDGDIDTVDLLTWRDAYGRIDIVTEVLGFTIYPDTMPDKAPKNTYTWGDVSFLIEIADGLGTGSRRAREARLQQLDKDKKKRLIRLICRVKGEKVYDEKKEVGDVQIKLEDAELVIEKVLGKMRVEKTNVV